MPETVAATLVARTESVLLNVLARSSTGGAKNARSSTGGAKDARSSTAKDARFEVQRLLLQLLAKVAGHPRDKPRTEPQQLQLANHVIAFLPVATATGNRMAAQVAALECAAVLSGSFAIFRGFQDLPREGEGAAWSGAQVRRVVELLASNVRAHPEARLMCERLLSDTTPPTAAGCSSAWFVALRVLVCAELQWGGATPTPEQTGGQSSLSVLLDALQVAVSSLVTAVTAKPVTAPKDLQRVLLAPEEAVQSPASKIRFVSHTLRALMASERVVLPANTPFLQLRTHPGMRVLAIILAAPASPFAALQPLLRLHLARIPDGGALELACQIVSSAAKNRTECAASLRRIRALGVLAVLVGSGFVGADAQRWGAVTGALLVSLASAHKPERQAAVRCGEAVLQRLRALASKKGSPALIGQLGGACQRLFKRKAELAADCSKGGLLAKHLAVAVTKKNQIRSTAVMDLWCATATGSTGALSTGALWSSFGRQKLIKIMCDAASTW